MELIVDGGSVAMALTAIAGFAVAAYRWFFRPMRIWLRHVHEIITYELKPNGGHSLADRLVRVETKLDEHLDAAHDHFEEQHNRKRYYDPEPRDAQT